MWNKEKIKKILNRYFIQGLSGMAMGLFCTLIVGLIIKQVAIPFGNHPIGLFLTSFGNIASVLMGPMIGVAIAHTLQVPKLVLYASGVTGLIGAYAEKIVSGKFFVDGGILLQGPGDPLGAFIAALVGMEIGKLISNKTRLDIIITPMVTITVGGTIGLLVGPPVSKGMQWLGSMIHLATLLQPFLMGIVLSTVMGMLLTLPISSAAISMMLGLSGIAGGAATVGCATQMIGFAVASYKDNGINGLLAQGLGTSMLQIGNILKKPLIWLPPTLASAILGPISTLVFHMENNPAGSGMGTSGLVGPLMTWQTMIEKESAGILLLKILLLYFVLPALLTWLINQFMRHQDWIKEGDMKLEL
ncbi:MAG: PTS sugar transporter subunit IIC [Epulopiscium sp.]|nr:PTS sugar transporter subunit IIC [Candidatus Epulonipiscium sp.]